MESVSVTEVPMDIDVYLCVFVCVTLVSVRPMVSTLSSRKNEPKVLLISNFEIHTRQVIPWIIGIHR